MQNNINIEDINSYEDIKSFYIKKAKTVGSFFLEYSQEMQLKYRQGDARILTFAKCCESINCFICNFKYSKFDDDENFLTVYFQYMIFGFFMHLFSSIESSLRLLAKSAELTYLNKNNEILIIGTEDFNTICDSLIKNLNLRSEYKNLLELFALIRNAQHNRGFYYPRGKYKDIEKKVSYKDKTYIFEPSKLCPGEAMHIDFVLEMAKDIAEFFRDIINSPKIASIPFVQDTLEFYD